MVESNPMLGLRGVRLSVVFGDLPLMQVRAVATAAARLVKEGVDPRPDDPWFRSFPSRPSMSRPARLSSA